MKSMRVRPATAVAAASDQGNRRMLFSAEHVVLSGWWRWAELASATEAGTSSAAWCVDVRTWHGFSEASDDVAPPSRDRVRLLGFVIFGVIPVRLGWRRGTLMRLVVSLP